MSAPEHDDAKPEFTDSDLRWYAALSGETSAEADSAATREGTALRMALEQRRQEMTSVASPDDLDESMQRQLERLQQRARHEGVFERAQPPAPATERARVIEFPWWRRRGALLAMAASVLVAVVVLPEVLNRPDYAEPPAMLGAGGAQQVHADSPRQAAERFAARLREAGLRPGVYQHGKTYAVDLDLLSADLPLAEPAFAELGLRPALGFNRVSFNGG